MHESWRAVLGDELETPHMQELRSFLVAEVAAGRRFYPPAPLVFNAMALTPLDQVRVVILGQDPYHGPGQAMGLCFSVPDGVPLPPSLRNIYEELVRDVGIPRPTTGDLTPWAQRGVLLLNAVLTVSPGKPASHAGKGWELFTDRAIRELSDRREGIVFLLWGRYAQDKGAIVDGERHHVLRAPHPSPYSAASGYFGCCHFSKANALLEADGRDPVDWRLP
jgi:uracil-DNA glycosylase